MSHPWPEKLGFRLHLLAWRLIRWSLRRRLRALGYDPARWVAEWEDIDLVELRNDRWMHYCRAEMEVGRHLLVEQRMAELAGGQPFLSSTVVTRDHDRFLDMARDLLNILARVQAGAPITGREEQWMRPRRWHEGIVPDTTSPPARPAEKVPKNEKQHAMTK